METPWQMISDEWLPAYLAQLKTSGIDLMPLAYSGATSLPDFEHYVIASSLYSAKIEGNSLDINSFMRNRQKPKQSKEMKEIEDLVTAYRYASLNGISLANFLQAHRVLSNTLLKKREQGKYRKGPIGVFDSISGRPVYMAVEADLVGQEMAKLFHDIAELGRLELSFEATCYYASMIHLWIAMIHPFADGNGRAARLLEKWFIASKLGYGAWGINTEKYYWDHRPAYYQHIALGYNYYALHWERCLPFLLMLPTALQSYR